jgi:hypothetical protein
MLSLELKKGADPRRWGLASILLYYEPAKEFLLLLFLLDGKIILSQTTLMNYMFIIFYKYSSHSLDLSCPL